jgi:hypothetical protein
MPLNVPAPTSSTGGNYDPIPADNHPGVCIGVIDLGTHQESYQGQPPKPVHKVKVQFELPDSLRDDGQSHVISRAFNLSMHEKSTFRQWIENWLGADETAKVVGQSLECLLLQPAMVNIEHVTDRMDPSRSFAVIKSISRLPKRMAAPEPTRNTFFLELDAKHLPPELSRRDAELIRKSAEYLAGGFTDEAPRPDGQGGGGASAASAAGYPAPSSAPFDETTAMDARV